MKIEFDNTRALIIPESNQENEISNIVKENTKVIAPGALYVAAHIQYKKTKGASGWDGKTSIIDKNNIFPTGLLPNIIEFLWKVGRVSPTLIDKRLICKVNINNKNVSVDLRDYQIEAINAGITNKFNGLFWPRGVFHHATGGGKTEIAVGLFELIPVRSIFIVDRKSLAVQTVERFENKYGWKCGRIYDKYFEDSPKMVVATIQSLIAKQDDPRVINLLASREQVFFDEAHSIAASLAKGNTFVHISNLLENAFFRWGLTATPFMKDQFSNWLLAGATGGVLHSKTTRELIDEDILVPPRIEILNSPKIHKCPNKWPECYDAGIILNSGRNKLIVDKLKTCPKPAIVLVKETSHLRILDRECKNAGLNGSTLQGNDELDVREMVLNNLEIGNIGFIITTLFNQGFDFPTLKTIIIASGMKSEILSIQRVGRGLRKAKGKNEVLIVDFWDDSSRTLKKHSKQRIKTYKEQGFEVEDAFLK